MKLTPFISTPTILELHTVEPTIIMVVSAYLFMKPFHINPIDLNNFCHEQDIEIRAVKLDLAFATLCILSVYRSPNGNFCFF
jgi:hypothetical protein